MSNEALKKIIGTISLEEYQHPLFRDAAIHAKAWRRFIATSPEQPDNINAALNAAAVPTKNPLNSSLGAIAEVRCG